MREQRGGTVTFVFTDIGPPTAHVKRLQERWPEIRSAHRRIVRQAFEAHGGDEVDTQGDSFFYVFGRTRDAALGQPTPSAGSRLTSGARTASSASASAESAGVPEGRPSAHRRQLQLRACARLVAVGALRFLAGAKRRPVQGAVERFDQEPDPGDRHSVRSEHAVHQCPAGGPAARQRGPAHPPGLQSHQRIGPEQLCEASDQQVSHPSGRAPACTVCPSNRQPFDPHFGEPLP